MKDILFDCYRQYQKRSKDNMVKAFFSLPVPALVLICLSLACVILNFMVIACHMVTSISFFLLIAEIAICIALYLFTDNYQIKTSDTRMKAYVNYCSKLVEWFSQTGFVVSKGNIEELKNRVDQHILDDQQRRNANQERFDKWCQALLFPILLAIFSAAIKEQTDIFVMLGYATTMIATIGLLYLGVYHCVNVLSFFEKRRLAQIKSFTEDLQGILDTQFNSSLIQKLDGYSGEDLSEQGVDKKAEIKNTETLNNLELVKLVTAQK